MSGVIIDGVQWEHCHGCQKWTRLESLGYERPSAAHPHGRDLCLRCANAVEDIETIEPAPNWKPVYAGVH